MKIELPEKPEYLSERIYRMCIDLVNEVNEGKSRIEKIGRIVLQVSNDCVEGLRKMVIDCSTGSVRECYDFFGIHDIQVISDEEGIFQFKLFLTTVKVYANRNEIVIEFPSNYRLDGCVVMSSINPLIQTLRRSYTWIKIKEVDMCNTDILRTILVLTR